MMRALQRTVTVMPFEDLCKLAAQMRGSLSVKDRSYRLRTYKQSFRGADAVEWMLKHGAADSVDMAIAMGNKMLELGLFHHVTYEHPFKNQAGMLYRFSADDPVLPGEVPVPPLRTSGSNSPDNTVQMPQPSDQSATSNGSSRQLARTATTSALETSGRNGSAAGLASRMLTGLGEGSHQYRAVVQAQLNNCNQRVSRVANDVRILQQVQRAVADEASALRDGIARVGGSPGDEGPVARLEAMQQQVLQLHGHIFTLYVVCSMQLLLVLGVCLLLGASATASITLIATTAGGAGFVWVLSASGALTRLAAKHTFARPPGGRTGKPAHRRSTSAVSTATTLTTASDLSRAESLDMRQQLVSKEQNQLRRINRTISVMIAESVPVPEDFRDHPDAPLLLRPSPIVPDLRMDPPYDGTPHGRPPALPLNATEPIGFETDLFKGAFVFHVRNSITCDEALFEGKSRLSWFVVQGKFKTPLPVNAVLTGSEFSRPFKRVPPRWLVDRVVGTMLRQLSPSTQINLDATPFLLSPLITTANLIHVAREGEEPPLMNIKEDMSLWEPALKGKSAAARTKHFASSKHRASHTFDTEHVWTFHIWQQFIDFSDYELSLGLTSYDLPQHLDGQPMQLIAKDINTGKYLFNMEVYHEALLPSQRRPSMSLPRASSSEEGSIGRGSKASSSRA